MKSFLLSLAAVSAASAIGQVPIAPSYATDPNVLIPSSNLRHANDPVKAGFTNYLIYRGPWNRPSLDNGVSPVVALNGPALLAPIPGYHPADIVAAYKMPSNGGQQAIAIVDAFHDAHSLQDFNKFASTFGLPQETSSNVTASTNQVFQVVYASGSQPAEDRGWAGEMSLDIEWAHAIAPNAKIYLIEATDNSFAALHQAETIAANLTNVKEVSMSYGSDQESADESGDDQYYQHPGVVYFAATGDFAGVRGYPSMSPFVVAVGGTTIDISNGLVNSLSVWSDAGAGPSKYIPRPKYQDGVQSITGAFRGTPDVSAIADPNTGVAIYDTYEGGWIVVGGTSLATPVVAAITNVRGAFATSTQAELTRQYGLLGQDKFLRDVTVGQIVTGGTGETFKALPGYDLASGLGEPISILKKTTTVAANPISASVFVGKPAGGLVGNLDTVDRKYFSVASVLDKRLGDIAGLTTVFHPAATLDGYTLDMTTLSVTIVASAPTSASNMAWIFNQSTGNYDYLGAFQLGNLQQKSFPLPSDLTNYLDSNGNLTLLSRAIQPRRAGVRSRPFMLKTDQFQITGTQSSDN